MNVVSIPRKDFNHGEARQFSVGLVPDAEIVVFLTQDALLQAPDSILTLCKVFEDESVGAAYGRQLPHHDAGPLGTHARIFNYPQKSRYTSLADADNLGIKAVFISNSFAAYRPRALKAVGGFPDNVILGEDTYVAAKMLLAGWHIYYCAEAQVCHSHNYSMSEEFRRYFDTGVFHAREYWLLKSFGKIDGEGSRFVKSEIRYLWRNAPKIIPVALLHTLFKYTGY